MFSKFVYNKNPKHTLLSVCWFLYFSAYIGRLNFVAALPQIILENTLSITEAGLVTTCFLVVYAIGQITSGFLGDIFSPYKMIFAGCFVSSLANLFMVTTDNPTHMMIIWAVNGMAQSLLWSPIVKLISEVFLPQERYRACITMNTSTAIGTLFTYLLVVVTLEYFHWQIIFYIAFAFLLLSSILFLVFFSSKLRINYKHVEIPKQMMNFSFPQKIWGIIFILPIAFLQGILKDSIITWIPIYLCDAYAVPVSNAVLLTTILSVFNLTGAFVALHINKLMRHKDFMSVGAMFLVNTLCLAGVFMVRNLNIYMLMLFVAVATTMLYAMGSILVSAIPVCFTKTNNVSSVSGILNSSIYLGSAVSMFLFSDVIDKRGFLVAVLIWAILSAISTLICFVKTNYWEKYKTENLI